MFMSLPPSSPALPIEEAQSEQGNLDTKIPAWPHTEYVESNLITHDHGEQEKTNNDHTLPELFKVEENAQRNSPLPTKKYEQVHLRDAKQLLAEKAADRKRKRQNKAMRTSAPRKRACGISTSLNKRDVESAEQVRPIPVVPVSH